MDRQLFEQLVARRQHAEDANRSGHCGRIGDHRISAHRDPVAARSRHITHRHHHRLAGLARQLQLAPHDLGSKGAAAGRVDPQHDRLGVVVLARLTDQLGGRIPADAAWAGFAVNDFTFGHDDADLLLRRLRFFQLAEVGAEVDLPE